MTKCLEKKGVVGGIHLSREEREAPGVTHLTSIPLVSGRDKAEGRARRQNEDRQTGRRGSWKHSLRLVCLRAPFTLQFFSAPAQTHVIFVSPDTDLGHMAR